MPKHSSSFHAPNETIGSAISRRQFGRLATAVTALAVSAPQALPSISPTQPPLDSADVAADAEVEAKLANIIRKYGSRLSDSQREHLRRILTYNQKMLASIRSFPIENGDAPATVLKLSYGEES